MCSVVLCISSYFNLPPPICGFVLPSQTFKKLSVLMLCEPVFIFTSGSSACCGLSISDCRYLQYSLQFSELIPIYYFFIFHEKTDKTREYSSPPFSYD